MTIKIAVVKESLDNETRVALVPEIAQKLASNNVSFIIEKNAGESSGFLDSAYPENACKFVSSSEDALKDRHKFQKSRPAIFGFLIELPFLIHYTLQEYPS